MSKADQTGEREIMNIYEIRKTAQDSKYVLLSTLHISIEKIRLKKKKC